MSNLGDFGIFGKLAMPTFQRHRFCGDLSSSHETMVFEIRAAGVISLLAVRFPMKISGDSKIPLANQDNQVVSNIS
jgi:hypothetical protein